MAVRLILLLSLVLWATALGQSEELVHCELGAGGATCMDGLDVVLNSPHDTFPAPLPLPSLRAPKFSPFVQQLLKKMSLREKIGQMTQLDLQVILNQTA